jgi:hypothetical protein
MNERIRELAEEACFDEIGKDYSLYFNLTKDKVEKFAELIIEECIKQVNKDHFGGPESWDRSLDNAIRNIKEHFGI